MTANACYVAFTLCTIALLGAVSIYSGREGPRYFGRILSSFALVMLVTTQVLGIGWTN